MGYSLRGSIAIVLLSLSTLAVACGSPPSSASTPYPGPNATSEQTLALPTPTRANSYPGPTPTKYPPSFKPTRTPTLVPTATPPPTAVPGIPAAFDALWAEMLPDYLPRPRGILWLADPTDIANRREVAHFEDEIDEAALSPDGQWVAVITRQEVQGGGPLWVVNLDGTGLRLLAPTRGWRILWSPDSQAVFYSGWGEEASSIERVNLSSGEWQQVRAVPSSGLIHLLGWSADGTRLYHFYQSAGGQYEIWAVAGDGQDAQMLITLSRDPGLPILSPDSSKFLIGTAQGLGWISPDGAEQQVIITQTSRGFSAIWSPDSRDLVVSQWQRGQPSVAIQAIDVNNRSLRELAQIPLDDWRLLSLSPDSQWMAAERIYDGLYWVHLPTQTVIPVGVGGQFVAWVKRAAP